MDACNGGGFQWCEHASNHRPPRISPGPGLSLPSIVGPMNFETAVRDGRARIDEFPPSVLAPLRDVQFFEQVFIDSGAVAWPGEIDLAPDAMYEQVDRKS